MRHAARIFLAALYLALLPCLVAASGPTVPQAGLGGVYLGDLTFTADTPDRAIYPETGAQGWHAGPGTQSIDFLVAFDNYFAANPGAHFVVMGRARTDAHTFATANWRGQGVLFGNVTGAMEAPPHAPVALIETWGKGALPAHARYLFPASMSPKLQDTLYRVSLQTTLSAAGLRYIRYTIHRMNWAVAAFDLVMDTGDVQDNNWTPDLMQQQGLILAHVAGSNLAPWQVRIMQLRVTWTPAYRNLPDLTALPWSRP